MNVSHIYVYEALFASINHMQNSTNSKKGGANPCGVASIPRAYTYIIISPSPKISLCMNYERVLSQMRKYLIMLFCCDLDFSNYRSGGQSRRSSSAAAEMASSPCPHMQEHKPNNPFVFRLQSSPGNLRRYRKPIMQSKEAVKFNYGPILLMPLSCRLMRDGYR
jgi:hypothetical protein